MARTEKSAQREDQLVVVGTDNNLAAYGSDDLWGKLPLQEIHTTHLVKNRIISAEPKNPANQVINMLRTRILQTMAKHGWRNIAITSPTPGCGSSFIAANLAVSFSRGESRRVVLMDMNLRRPSLASLFGISPVPSISEFLSGYLLAEEFFIRAGPNLALGLNAASGNDTAELLLENLTGDVLTEIQDILQPDIVLYDMPPALPHDDLLAILPKVDAVLLVAGGGLTTPEDIAEVEKMLGETTPLLAVVLNKAEGV